VPTTTNLMLSTGTKWMDYFSWAGDLDVVANDHYLRAHDPDPFLTCGGLPASRTAHASATVSWEATDMQVLP
jgi:beta-galactosidase